MHYAATFRHTSDVWLRLASDEFVRKFVLRSHAFSSFLLEIW